MKVRFNLKSFDIDTTKKTIVDYQGNELVTATLESILSLISNKYLYNEFESVEIHHTRFANITNNYRHYLNFLRDKNVILIDESYKKGVHSKSYLFTDYFKEYGTVKLFKIDQGKEVEKNDNSIIIDNIVKKRLEQDYHEVNVKTAPIEKEVRFVKDDQPITNFRKYLMNEYGLYQLRNGTRKITYQSGRLYTPFVQLSKEIRRDYLYFDSQLTSLDIKRSFPLWLAVWLIDKGIQLDYDTKCFLSSVVSGNIYYDLISKFNNNKNLYNNTEFDKPFITKDQVKKLFSNWLNGNPNLNNLPNLIMKTYYPLIFDFIKHFKNGFKDRMYYELVKLESNFIFNTVCKRLYMEIPGIQLLTCHDEIYFEERFYEQVLQIWNEELENVYHKIPVEIELEDDVDINELESLGIYLE